MKREINPWMIVSIVLLFLILFGSFGMMGFGGFGCFGSSSTYGYGGMMSGIFGNSVGMLFGFLVMLLLWGLAIWILVFFIKQILNSVSNEKNLRKRGSK